MTLRINIMHGLFLLAFICFTEALIEGRSDLTSNQQGADTATADNYCGLDCDNDDPHKLRLKSGPYTKNEVEGEDNDDVGTIYCYKYKISLRSDTEFVNNEACYGEQASHIVLGPYHCSFTCEDLTNMVYQPLTGCTDSSSQDDAINSDCTVYVGTDTGNTGNKGIRYTWATDATYPHFFQLCVHDGTFSTVNQLYDWKAGYYGAGYLQYSCQSSVGVTITGPRLCETPSPTGATPPPTTAEPTTSEPTTSEPTTAEPTTAEPTTAEPTTAEPTTAEPTTTGKPTIAPTFQMCDEFMPLNSDRRADYLVMSDMSLDDGTYNDVCDYYRRENITIEEGYKLSGANSPNPGQLRIGTTMQIKVDLLVAEACSTDECEVLSIGTTSDDFYPKLQITSDGAIRIVTTEYNETNGSRIITGEHTSDASILSYGSWQRLVIKWREDQLKVKYGGDVVINKDVNNHPYDTTIWWDDPDAGAEGTLRHQMYASLDGPAANAKIKNLCIKTSHTPDGWREMPSVCQAKQNMAAEAITALKGHDGLDLGTDGTDFKNVRYGYIEFDRDTVEVVTLLTDDINIAPVYDDDLLTEFKMVQGADCGVGTNDETDLCGALQAAFDEFDRAGNSEFDSFDPERERKLLIVSHNNNTECSDGQNICDRFQKEIQGGGDNTFGTSVFMINIDMDGMPQDSYEPCLVMADDSRIADIETLTHLTYTAVETANRDTLIGVLKDCLCVRPPSPNPTRDPTVDPTQIPTWQPTVDPTLLPTWQPTADPTTDAPTTDEPTTSEPTTAEPTTAEPTTAEPTTSEPTTSEPTTAEPTTAEPTTAEPTTAEPTTSEPTTSEPTTAEPTTAEPTTAEPTTAEPTTAEPTTAEPTTAEPTTSEPTTAEPTTAEPTTSEPTTAEPTTAEPTTSEPTTSEPTTAEPTTAEPTTSEPTTAEPTTSEPTTSEPTTAEPTTSEPTTAEPTTAEPTTAEPTTAEPTTAEPTTAEPTTAEPTTSEPTTAEPTTAEPTTSEPTTSEPTTSEPTTSEPTTSEPTTSEPTTSEPTTSEPTTSEPTTAEPTTSEPTTSEPTTTEPTTGEPTTAEPTTAEPTPFSSTVEPCTESRRMDLVIMNDVSCKMTRSECKTVINQIATSFRTLRTSNTERENGKDRFIQRIAFLEFGSTDSAGDLNSLVEFYNNGRDDSLPINMGSNETKLIADPEAENDIYYDFILSRKAEVCTQAHLNARQGDPALNTAIAHAIDELYPRGGSAEQNRDREMLIYSSCATNDRANTCDTYYHEIRHAVKGEKVSAFGINVNMVNLVPEAPNAPTGDDDMEDAETYLACLVEWDPDSRVHVLTPTTDVTEDVRDEICMEPTKTPTVDPTIDPTRDPTAYNAEDAREVENARIDIMIKPMDGLEKHLNGIGSESKLFALYTSYSLWIFAVIVCVFSLNVVVCCCVKVWCGKKTNAKSKIYGFIKDDGAVANSSDESDSDIDFSLNDDEDKKNLV